MRLLILMMVILAGFSVPCVAQEKSPEKSLEKLQVRDTALRGFIWGLPKEVIIENETATLIEPEEAQESIEDTIFFLDVIQGMRSTIGYEFQGNKLWRAKIFIEKKYYQHQERINDLMTIQQSLTQRFGEPVIEDLKWFKKTEMNYPGSWGWAVSRGELVMTSVWRHGDTEVTTYLGTPAGASPILTVTYVHIPTKELQALKREQELMLMP